MSKIRSAIMQLINNPRMVVYSMGVNGLFNYLPDSIYLKLMFNAKMGYHLNLDKPNTFSEKLQWLKIHDRKSEYTKYADKYAVREHISELIGEKYIIPLLGVYTNEKDIPWENLPCKFVIKCTHGSGMNIICKDKEVFDVGKAQIMLNKWLRKNAFYGGREWQYKDIEPRIIIENYYENEKDEGLQDYKVLCFNGQPELIEVHSGRFSEHGLFFYDTNWSLTNIQQKSSPLLANKEITKPRCLDEMLKCSKIIAKDFYHMRVDWFIIDDRPLFAEMTFYDASGFDPFVDIEDDYRLGKLLKLPID